jgi:hypothetical protein
MRKSIKNLSAVTTVGLDIAKNVFQVHGVDAAGFVVVAKAVADDSFFMSAATRRFASSRKGLPRIEERHESYVISLRRGSLARHSPPGRALRAATAR